MQVRRLAVKDAPEYRALRLRAFRDHPEAFTTSFEELEAQPLSDTEKRFGVEPRAIKVGGRAYAKNHMYLELT